MRVAPREAEAMGRTISSFDVLLLQENSLCADGYGD